MASKRPTTTDIARLAGVSQSTVSMILSGRPSVSFSPETIQRVCSAAEQLGYRPRKRNGGGPSDPPLVAVVTPTPGNPYYSTLIQALENQASSNGYNLLTCNTYYDADTEGRYLDLLASSIYCGVIFTYMPYNRERVRALSLSFPVVIIGDKADSIDIDTVALNSRTAGELVARHLYELGHRQIAFITTQLDNNIQRQRRLDGIRPYLEKRGARLLVQEASVNLHRRKYSLNIEYDVGYKLAAKTSADPAVTAYIGVNDMVAYGIMDALLAQGRSIPGDCSVCGFDNIFPSCFANISLTTIDSCLTEKGRDAFELLMRKITDRPDTNATSVFQIEYNPKIIIRGSTGPAAGR